MYSVQRPIGGGGGLQNGTGGELIFTPTKGGGAVCSISFSDAEGGTQTVLG